MTREEAKLILQACRPCAADLDDPQVVAALDLAAGDPELMASFKEQQGFDAMISRKLNQFPVPPGLEQKVIAATKRPHPARVRWNQTLLAWAASIVILGSILLIWMGRSGPDGRDEVASLRTHFAKFLRTFPRLDVATERWPEISEWLAQKTTVDVEVPGQLKNYPGLGCRELQWKEKRLFLICFVAQGEIVHLLLLPNSDFSELPPISAPAFVHVKGWSTASWSQGKVSYFALTKGSESFLQGLLANQKQG